MLLNMFITLNFILHDAVFIYNIVRLYLGCKLNFFYIVCNTGHIIMLCESIIYIYIYIYIYNIFIYLYNIFICIYCDSRIVNEGGRLIMRNSES